MVSFVCVIKWYIQELNRPNTAQREFGRSEFSAAFLTQWSIAEKKNQTYTTSDQRFQILFILFSFILHGKIFFFFRDS